MKTPPRTWKGEIWLRWWFSLEAASLSRIPSFLQRSQAPLLGPGDRPSAEQTGVFHRTFWACVSGRGQQWTSKQTRKKEHFGCCSGYADKGEWWKRENWAGAGAGWEPSGKASLGRCRGKFVHFPAELVTPITLILRLWRGVGAAQAQDSPGSPSKSPCGPCRSLFQNCLPPRPDPEARLASRFPVALRAAWSRLSGCGGCK